MSTVSAKAIAGWSRPCSVDWIDTVGNDSRDPCSIMKSRSGAPASAICSIIALARAFASELGHGLERTRCGSAASSRSR